jgi:drug/metabolite transporter (DMT)-like permease
LLSYGMISMQQLVTDRGHTPLIANGISMCIGGFLALSSSYLTEPLWIHGDATYLAALMALQILISNLFCANLQAFLLKRYSATLLSLTSFLAPLSAICYGSLFLQEHITWHLFAALFMVILGLVCYHLEEIQHKRALLLNASSSPQPTE